jgi:hypothetical protein
VAEPVFDIFSGKPDKDPLWLETVEGFDQARERMERIAAERPGRYFLFSTQAQAVLAETETFAKSESARKVQRAR